MMQCQIILKKLLLSLNEPWFLKNLHILTGIENLVSDPNFHGGNALYKKTWKVRCAY